MLLDTLRMLLTKAGIDAASLRSLHEAVTEDNADLASLPETKIEKQYPIYTLESTQGDVLSLWERLRKLTSETDYYPVVLGNRDEIGRIWERREYAKPPQAFLDEAQSRDAQSWLQEQWDTWSEFTGNPILSQEWDEEAVPWLSLRPKNLFPRNAPQIQYIGLVGTTESWQTPAFLSFGNYNDCLRASFHICVHRYWQSKFKSEIVVMTDDSIVCRVDSPVTTRDAALALAIEQTAYCSDAISITTLGELASGLVNSRYWSFWWD